MTSKTSFFFVLSVFLLVTGCQQANEYAPPPPPKVTVALPHIQQVTDYLEFTGTTVATAQVEVRARVAGILQSMHFEPGSQVKQGDLLLIIDPAEYQANLQAAKAEMAAAKAARSQADIEHGRALSLYQEKAGTETDVVKWRVEGEVAAAQILGAQAKIDRANLNLGYTKITAPIDGRVGRNQVDIGNLVGEGEATLLTDISHFDPMYVYFNLNERDLLRVLEFYRAKLKEKEIDPRQVAEVRKVLPLYLGLATEKGYPHRGMYDFGESGVDPETGTVQLRGVFDNPGTPPVLLPGLFARIRMPITTRDNIPLVTERAIGADQSGRFILIVNSDNTVEKRNIRQGQLIDGLRVIEAGVDKDERVVVNGIQRARPGAKVEPDQVDMSSLTVSARQAAAKAAATATPAQQNDPAGH